jgi:lipoprotein signal peptidase
MHNLAPGMPLQTKLRILYQSILVNLLLGMAIGGFIDRFMSACVYVGVRMRTARLFSTHSLNAGHR